MSEVNYKPLTGFTKLATLDVWQSSSYASVNSPRFFVIHNDTLLRSHLWKLLRIRQESVKVSTFLRIVFTLKTIKSLRIGIRFWWKRNNLKALFNQFFTDSSENGKLLFVFPVWTVLATIFGIVKTTFCIIGNSCTISVIQKVQLYYHENKGHDLCLVSYHCVIKIMKDFKMEVLYCLILTSLAITRLNFVLMCFVINHYVISC